MNYDEEIELQRQILKEYEFIISRSKRPFTYGKPWQAYLPKFMQVWFIPKGDYCYKHAGRVKKCVFWDAYEDSWETMCPGGAPDSVCHFLGEDPDHLHGGICLDDQCKECGVKDSYE
jgi:hypothetical protein